MAARPGAVGTTSPPRSFITRSEEHTSELQSRLHLVCRLLLEKKKNTLTNLERTAETDAYGKFTMSGLPIDGNYNIRAAKEGFAAAHRTNMTLRGEATADLNL